MKELDVGKDVHSNENNGNVSNANIFLGCALVT